MPIDTSQLDLRNVIVEGNTYNNKQTYRTESDGANQLALKIIQANFPDYFNSTSATLSNKFPARGAKASFDILGNSIIMPRPEEFTTYSPSGTVKGPNTDQILDRVLTIMHEITHARSPVVPSKERLSAGAPSKEAVNSLVSRAKELDSFPSLEQNSSEELLATLIPLRDLNRKSITVEGPQFKQAQQDYKKLEKEFPWLDNYIAFQSKPELKPTPKHVDRDLSVLDKIKEFIK